MHIEDLEEFVKKIEKSDEYVCSYYPQKKQRLKAFFCKVDIDGQYLDYLFSKGFRRCGELYYINYCDVCRDCIPYRIRLDDLKLDRSQKRNLKINSDIKMLVNKLPVPTDEKEKLYIKYQHETHFKKDLSKIGKSFSAETALDSMYNQMYTNFGYTIEFEFFLDEKLIGFAVFDAGSKSISAVYSVYDPDLKKRGLGTFAILNVSMWAKEHRYKYNYLGLYLPGHKKMDYKSKFMESEICDIETGIWSNYEYI